MKIEEVSEKYAISSDALRYYEKVGILKNIPRKNGIREYDEASCKKIEFVKCMREAGVEIGTLCRYMDLFEQGSSTASQRKELLEEQQVKLLEKKQAIENTLKKLEYKITLYEKIEQGLRKDFTEDL